MRETKRTRIVETVRFPVEKSFETMENISLTDEWTFGNTLFPRHFLVVRCPRKHEKTHADWR